jgi:hypothetical protein
MKKIIYNLFFIALLASPLMTACNKQTQEIVAPKAQENSLTLETTSTLLINDALFVAYMTTTTDFAQKTANIVAPMSSSEATTYFQQLHEASEVYEANPTISNLTIYVTLLGFQDVAEYNGKLNDMKDANRNLRVNYAGFSGLTNSEIDEIIEVTAEEYQLRWGWWDRLNFRWCANRAARHFANSENDVRQYDFDMARCREKWL